MLPDAKPATPIADAYRDPAAKIIAAARGSDAAYKKLQFLTDHIGNRLSGSPQLDQAIAWAQKAMTDDGLDVHTEKVMVPHWVRGAEAGAIVAPIQRDMVVLGLGGTVATPKGGLTAPVVVVTSWDELKAKGDQVKGKIVLYDVEMPAYDPVENNTHYGDVVPFRWAGASQAAKLGAVAVLVRSVTHHSLRTPHTGAMGYEDKVPKIPALAVTPEDATLLHRLADEGEVKVHVLTSGKTLPDAPSANVIAELKGREKPDEIVVIGGHIDSWDVGQGAHDDGAGITTCMQALATIKALGLQPRRTIRVVLFTNEENGLRGGKGYADAHKDELPKTVAALESDLGAFPPNGFQITAPEASRDRVIARVTDLASLLGELDATHVIAREHGGADVEPMAPAGVVVGDLDVRAATYFDYHHTPADTLDKIDPKVLADDVATVAVFAYVIADLPDRIDAP
ncbi:MAG TPA: M20/M25/M40 family metallo-hydrolase [Kofleriaceae bacterium]|nr:M20/M25/M40 family metallo-hydrolase [Kofleriaceae bacterium]